MQPATANRVRTLVDRPVNPDGQFVLYWMVAFRRVRWNFSLQHAVHWAEQLNKPLLILEALRCGYRWASQRLHHFIIQGMAEHQQQLADKPVRYYPYVEPECGAGSGLLPALARHASIVISDDYPCFFIPRMLAAAAARLETRFEVVDSNGLLPLRAAPQAFSRAYDFRRFLQKNLRPHLDAFPQPDPLEHAALPACEHIPKDVLERWPSSDVRQLADDPQSIAHLPIDHAVPVTTTKGGERAGKQRLTDFLQHRLANYADARGLPSRDGTSGLSPYLHFGQISPHEVFASVMEHDGWAEDKISAKSSGSAQGWWGASRNVEAFLDEMVTWRELGFNMCCHCENYDQYDSLPDWAQATLQKHAADPRSHIYTLEQFAAGSTHDPLWNAAQRQLVREGRIHNYLRMLWGKKILEWSSSPREALDYMLELNNRYALDGRDPNSYSGIFWVLGRYDRPWGPERPVYGKIRYMSSENTARKVQLAEYLQKFSE